MHQTLETIFYHISKHLKVCHKFLNTPHHVLNSVLDTTFGNVVKTVSCVLRMVFQY